MIGTVTSNKMLLTAVVSVEKTFTHPMYHKRIRSDKKYHVHNTVGAKTGDKVRFVETKPKSRTRRWVIEEIVK